MTARILGDRLGGGAITEAFVATSIGAEGFEKPVVVKRVHAALGEIPRFVEGFLAEAQRASKLSHANVVLFMDVARDDAGYHVVTEHVDGVDLGRLVALARGAGVALPEATVAYVAAEIAKGLDYAHRRRGGAVVHGGLSLSNVLVSREGAVKISDFGLHRAREDARFAPNEERALPFRSPERVAGGEATKAGDVFALGAVIRALASAVAQPAGAKLVEELASPLLGPEDARPTAGEVHERVLAWAYQRGGVALQATELAKLVARLRERSLPTAPSADDRAFEPATDPPSRVEGAPRVAAKLRELVLLAVVELGEAESESLVREAIASRGGVVVSSDAAELRAVFGLRSEEGRDVRDALRAALAIIAGGARVGVAVDLGRAPVDERGELVEDAGGAARFARVAALAGASRGRVLATTELMRVASVEFSFGAHEGRAEVLRERERPLVTSKFVGRRDELARLGARVASSRAGVPSVVAITGEAGAGKTRLALELERRAHRLDPSIRSGIIASADDAWDALDLVIVELEDAATCDAAVQRVERAARAARSAGARTAWLLLARTSSPAIVELADEVIPLGPLADDEVDELAASLLGARVLTPELLEQLRRLSERTPLFVGETVRDWLDQAVVVVRDGVAVLHATTLPPPRTLRALVEARLDRVTPESLATLRALAVAGDEATDAEIARIAGVSIEAARDARASTSTLARQVLLDTVPAEARRALHAAAEDALAASEASSPSSAARRAERIGLHRAARGDDAGALESFVRAANGYTRASDRGRAAASALRSMPLRGALDAGPIADALPRLVAMLASGAEEGAGVEGWMDLARDALERIDRSGALADRVAVRLEVARLGVHLAAVPEARVALDQASNLAVDLRLRARVLATEIELAIRTGEIARGRDAASALFELGAVHGQAHPLRELESPTILADAAEIFGAARDERAAEAALALALDIGADVSPAVRAAIEARRARVELLLGHAARAHRTSVIAVDLADAVGATRLRADAKLTLAESAIHAGRLDRAYAALVAALEASESSGHARASTSAAALLAWLDAPADPDAAREKLAALALRAEGTGFAADALAIQLLAGRLLDGEPARAVFRSVEADAKRLGHLSLAAEAAAQLAR